MTQHVVFLLIIDIESAKSDVNGPKKKRCFWGILMKNMTRTAKNMFKTYRFKLY